MATGESQPSYSRDSLESQVPRGVAPTIDEQRHSYQQSQWLKWFQAQKTRTRGERLAVLQALAAVRFTPDPYQVFDPVRMRRHYERRKAAGRLNFKRRICWVCHGPDAEHRHHVIAIAHGGRNRKSNLVPLCRACHCDVHGREF